MLFGPRKFIFRSCALRIERCVKLLTANWPLVYGGKNKQDDFQIMFESLFANTGLSLERLKTFREIVAAGGITAAAGDDSNRQSQFSRQLKELEKYFGVELLKRGRGPAELTDAGERLYEIIGHTLSALEEFRLPARVNRLNSRLAPAKA